MVRGVRALDTFCSIVSLFHRLLGFPHFVRISFSLAFSFILDTRSCITSQSLQSTESCFTIAVLRPLVISHVSLCHISSHASCFLENKISKIHVFWVDYLNSCKRRWIITRKIRSALFVSFVNAIPTVHLFHEYLIPQIITKKPTLNRRMSEMIHALDWWLPQPSTWNDLYERPRSLRDPDIRGRQNVTLEWRGGDICGLYRLALTKQSRKLS